MFPLGLLMARVALRRARPFPFLSRKVDDARALKDFFLFIFWACCPGAFKVQDHVLPSGSPEARKILFSLAIERERKILGRRQVRRGQYVTVPAYQGQVCCCCDPAGSTTVDPIVSPPTCPASAPADYFFSFPSGLMGCSCREMPVTSSRYPSGTSGGLLRLLIKRPGSIWTVSSCG